MVKPTAARQHPPAGLLARTAQAVRHIFRPATSGQRAFHAARVDNTTANWLLVESSINEELRSDLDRLRVRGRNLRHNNDYAAKFVGMCGDNIIGPNGVRLQSKVRDPAGTQDRGANNAIETAWARWDTVADITGRQTFREMCRTMVEGMPSDGEFLLRIVTGRDAGNAFNMALQIIDVDRIDTMYNGTYGGNTVIMGVELNAYRRPVALHLFEGHPSDGARTNRRRVRVPAEEIIHGYKQERADQVRGIPWMAPGMLSLHHLGGFGLAALLAAEHGANHYGFFTTPDDNAPAIGDKDPDTQQTIATTQPGIYDTLPAGTNFTPHESKYPNEVFSPFWKCTLQRIASGWKVAYHSLANDLEGVNFSSIRSGTLEERDKWAADQQWFIETVLERIYPQWLRMALLSGAITLENGSALPAVKYEKFLAHQWQPRRWEWVDPRADTAATIDKVRAGLTSPQAVCATMGEDFEDVVVSISEAQKLAAQYGVRLTAYDATPGANSSASADPVTPDPAPAGNSKKRNALP